MPVVHHILLLFPLVHPVMGQLDIFGLMQIEPNFGRFPKIALLWYRGKSHLNQRGWNSDVFHIIFPDVMHHSAQYHGCKEETEEHKTEAEAVWILSERHGDSSEIWVTSQSLSPIYQSNLSAIKSRYIFAFTVTDVSKQSV